MFYGIQSKNYKEIDTKKIKGFLSKNKSKFIQPRLREYDNFRKLIYNFMKKKYKYVSYVYGGFEKIHEESIKYNIPLLNHDENCFLCKKKYSKISQLLKEKDNKKQNTAKNFFFGRKDSDANKNKMKDTDKKLEKSYTNDNIKINDKPRNSNNSNHNYEIGNGNVNNANNKEKKEGFFSKLFGKNNKNKNESNLVANRKISDNGKFVHKNFDLN